MNGADAIIGPVWSGACLALHADVLDVDVGSGIHVVEEVPAWMIGIVVNDKLVAASSPAPIGGEAPIPRRYFEPKSSGKPEPVEANIHAQYAERVLRSDVRKSAVRVWVVEVEARIVAGGMTIPMVVAHVLTVVDVAVGHVFSLGRSGSFAPVRRRGRVATISCMVVLREERDRRNKHQSRHETESFLHKSLLLHGFLHVLRAWVDTWKAVCYREGNCIWRAECDKTRFHGKQGAFSAAFIRQPRRRRAAP
jgi:hypothetical protein